MRCHNCPHHESINASIPWERLPCATCKLGEDTFYSVPFDEENPPEPAAGYPHSMTTDFRPRTFKATLFPAEVLSQFVQGLLCLPPEVRDVVAWRYQGVPYKEIALRQGTSIQLAEMRHKRALREWPVLKSLFPDKVAKRQRRQRSLS